MLTCMNFNGTTNMNLLENSGQSTADESSHTDQGLRQKDLRSEWLHRLLYCSDLHNSKPKTLVFTCCASCE